MRTFYISLRGGRTGGVDVEGNLIVAVPPIWNHWKGQPFVRFLEYHKPVNMYEVPNGQENKKETTPQT